MACVSFSSDDGSVVGYACIDDYFGRLHIGNKYIWVSHHRYCGPTFYHDREMSKIYDPVNEDDPIWEAFSTWLTKKEKNE